MVSTSRVEPVQLALRVAAPLVVRPTLRVVRKNTKQVGGCSSALFQAGGMVVAIERTSYNLTYATATHVLYSRLRTLNRLLDHKIWVSVG